MSHAALPLPPIPPEFIAAQFLQLSEVVEDLLVTDAAGAAIGKGTWSVLRAHLHAARWPGLRPDLDGARALLLDAVTEARGCGLTIAQEADLLDPQMFTEEDTP